ncbi:hypothetical protein QLQ12_00915 [Actinoplanes sp. NEAU-A12]|uniref:Uncharacterized protein n=1 Tax=Actinoplanes sandaracinus TaxID=3045177 RepID=A0ABT6WBT2_9ACTN|nr:hypothetical protein [Actinoplanes sandaracinus]MDI6097169.1 hypothetical protein [Actinoplanes sandaracinus]
MAGALLLGTAVAATAAPTTAEPTLPPATGAKAEHSARSASRLVACPQPGQRVQTPTSSAAYLIDPDFYANWIPNQTIYFALNEAVFNKYAFAWNKIRVQSVSPVSSLNWDH